MSKKVIITGAGGGFGKLTTFGLLKAGYKVAGTLRDINIRNAGAAEELRNAGALAIEMDVTDDNSVANGIASAI